MQTENSATMLSSYPGWQNFQFSPNNHYWFFFLHILLSTIAFKLLQLLHQNIYIFSQEMFGSVPIYNIDVQTFGGKWHQNWHRNVKKTPWQHASPGARPYLMHHSVMWKLLSGMQDRFTNNVRSSRGGGRAVIMIYSLELAIIRLRNIYGGMK